MNIFNAGRLRRILMSIILAVCTGHYLEYPQMKVFSSLKAYLTYGAPYTQEVGGQFLLSRLMSGNSNETYINPVLNAQLVLNQSEKYLITKFYPDHTEHIFEDVVVDPAEIVEITDRFMQGYPPEIIDGLSIVRFPYYVDMDYTYGGLKNPWFSGMASGHVLILALASVAITNDQKYVSFAENIVNGYKMSVPNGGFTYKDISGTFFEEYADQTVMFVDAPKVLNGHFFAIDGLFWYWHFNRENRAIRDLLVSSLVYADNNIHKYYAQFWSYYDDYKGKRHYADGYYHGIHVKQLNRVTQFYLPLVGVEFENLHVASSDFARFRLLPLGFIERLLFQRNRMITLVFFSNFSVIYLCLFFFRRFLNRRKFS